MRSGLAARRALTQLSNLVDYMSYTVQSTEHKLHVVLQPHSAQHDPANGGKP